MDVSPAPGTPAAHLSSKKLLAALGVLVLILVLGGGYWFSTTTAYKLHGTRYVAGPFASRGIYEMGWRGPKAISLPVPGRVIDYARQGHVQAAVVVASDGKQDIYRIVGAKAERLTMDGKTKSGLTLSPDGGEVAYSERTGNASSSTSVASFYAPAAWQVMLLKVSDPNRAPLFMGNGFGPQFFMFNGVPHLLYTTERSLHFVNLSTNANQDVAIDRGTLIGLSHAAVSSSGAYVALPNVGSGYFLYSLTQKDGHFAVTPVGALPPYTVAVAFSGDHILSLSLHQSVAALREGTLGSPSVIQYGYRLPNQLVTNVVP